MNNKITKIDVRNFELEMCIWIGKYPKKTLKVHEKYIFFLHCNCFTLAF